MTPDTKKAHHSLQAEKAVIGACLLDETALALAADELSPDAFFHAAHRLIFDACLSLFNAHQPADLVSVTNALDFRKQLDDAGGPAYIASLANDVPTTANIAHYVGIVKSLWRLRIFVAATAAAYKACYSGQHDSPDDAIVEAERLIFDAAASSQPVRFASINAIAAARVEEYGAILTRGQSITGISTGFPSLDAITAGFQRASLNIIAARPSIGKTALALKCASKIAEAKSVAFFSIEMAAPELFDRILCDYANIDGQTIRTGQFSTRDLQSMAPAVAVVSHLNMMIDASPSLSPTELRSRLRRLKAERPVDVVFIDYIQLMHAPGFDHNREREISYISQNLKAIAKDFQIPVIALSQLNRESEKNASRKSGVPSPPKLSDLRESGSIEQDADLVMLIHRPGFYNRNIEQADVATINIAKQRNGPTGHVDLRFDTTSSSFHEL